MRYTDEIISLLKDAEQQNFTDGVNKLRDLLLDFDVYWEITQRCHNREEYTTAIVKYARELTEGLNCKDNM